MNLRRGDVVIVADKSGQFTGKPRPAVVVQANAYSHRNTITICPITSTEIDASLFRVPLKPSRQLPLARSSWIEVDLITTVRRGRVSEDPIGRMSDEEIVRLTASMAVYLGIA